ncbi:MAG TPA: hypothetical protein VFF73_07000 [Planctomycetota bacterium]|nr:hypothetical protein [Planctomycetota bacterium]
MGEICHTRSDAPSPDREGVTAVLSPVWKYALGALLVGLVGVMVAFLRSRKKPELPPIPGTHILRFGLAVRLLAVVIFILSVGLIVGVIAFPKQQEIPQFAWTIAGGFVVAAVIMVIEVFGVSHRLSDEGIESASAWTEQRTVVRWKDVASIRYNATTGWYVITSRTGATVRLNGLLSGLRTFSRFVHERVEPSAYADASTQKMLERGTPFWG